MPDQIQIKFREGQGSTYEASMDALRMYDPAPSLKGAVNLKGNYTAEALGRVVDLVQELEVDGKLALDISYADADSPARFAGGVNIKGEFTRERVDKIIAVARELGLESAFVLTGTWGKNQEVAQMQLFPPTFRE